MAKATNGRQKGIEVSEKESSGFFIADFGIDGELEGVEYLDLSKLSENWLMVCDDFLESNSDCFDAAWKGPLSHIQTRVTAEDGTAIVTFQAHGYPVASISLASGYLPGADSEVIKMFVDSLRRVNIVRAAAQSQVPFEAMLTISERPVMMVVTWAFPEVSEQDNELVFELGLHIAGAFFAREAAGNL